MSSTGSPRCWPKPSRRCPGFQDVTTDLQLKNPQVDMEIDRDKAASLGISAAAASKMPSTGLRRAADLHHLRRSTNQFSVIMELEPEHQMDPGALSLLYVRSSSGALVPLSGIANIRQGYGPLTVNHSGQLPSVTISFNLRPGFALGDAVSAMNLKPRSACCRRPLLPISRVRPRCSSPPFVTWGYC